MLVKQQQVKTRKSGLTIVMIMVIATIMIDMVMCHMQMSAPSPRRTLPVGGTDYDLSAPLGAQKPFPCGGKTALSTITTWSAGSTVSVTISGGAPHGGGHCQFAISPRNDQKKWIVLADALGTCPLAGTYSFQVPSGVPNGDYVFTWTWINAVGNREYYMNCADIQIINGGSRFDGKQLLVANIPDPNLSGNPVYYIGVIGEFAGAPSLYQDKFPLRPAYTLTSSGISGGGSGGGTTNTTNPTNPTNPTTPTTPTNNSTCNYFVVSGDTLNAIAAKYGTTLAVIYSLNPSITDPTKLQVGDKVVYPCSGSSSGSGGSTGGSGSNSYGCIYSWTVTAKFNDSRQGFVGRLDFQASLAQTNWSVAWTFQKGGVTAFKLGGQELSSSALSQVTIKGNTKLEANTVMSIVVFGSGGVSDSEALFLNSIKCTKSSTSDFDKSSAEAPLMDCKSSAPANCKDTCLEEFNQYCASSVSGASSKLSGSIVGMFIMMIAFFVFAL